eukprot:TRINITY_DN67754_c0_g1_i1.p1 TRINITY_DN67754_c0_g1~~TRINITY_DN67754_c0_g1_i1.p1  ORF type:complete len:794 (+),score=132.20 TRINITY_DN67754_c0_g1_i1:355-2382(+)
MEATRQAKMAVDNMDARHAERVDAARNSLTCHFQKELEDVRGELQTLRNSLETIHSDLLAALKLQAEKFAEGLDRESSDCLQRLELSRAQSTACTQEVREFAKVGLENISCSLKAMQIDSNEKTDALLAEMQGLLHRQDSQSAHVAEHFEDEVMMERKRVDASISEVREDAVKMSSILEHTRVALQADISHALNIATRKVEWIIPSAVHIVRTRDSRSLFSPRFDAGCERNFQLELHAVRSSDKCEVDGHESGDCFLQLWASKGAKVSFRLCIGSVYTSVLEHEFNGWEPHRSKRIWFLDDQVNQEDGLLRIGFEILDTSRVVDALPSRQPISTSRAASPVEMRSEQQEQQPHEAMREDGSLIFSRVVSNRTVQAVDNAIAIMKSHMLRRVEWRLQQASSLRACYAEGKCICSVPFVAAGVAGLQIVLYPCGYLGARQGYFSLFLKRPTSSLSITLQAFLRIGKQRWEAQQLTEQQHLFGRVNFGRFDTCVDASDDSILVVLEIQEAPQEVLEVGGQQDCWRTVPRPPGRPPTANFRKMPPAGKDGGRPSTAIRASSSTRQTTESPPKGVSASELGSLQRTSASPVGPVPAASLQASFASTDLPSSAAVTLSRPAFATDSPQTAMDVAASADAWEERSSEGVTSGAGVNELAAAGVSRRGCTFANDVDVEKVIAA